MRFAICNELFQDWEYRRIVEFVAATGYDGLEIAPYTFADSVFEISAARRHEIKTIAADAGIAITGLHWLLVKPGGLHICDPEASTRQRTVDYLRRLIDFCADIGGAVMIFGSPNQRKIAPGISREQGWQWALESLAACGATAASRGVTLCLEALPENLTNLLNTNAEVLAMVRQIDHPNIRMMLDVKSMCAEAVGIPENVRTCAAWFLYVHANDTNGLGPGFGRVDFRPILAALAEIKYNGFVSVEVFDFTPGPEATARRSLQYLKECIVSGKIS